MTSHRFAASQFKMSSKCISTPADLNLTVNVAWPAQRERLEHSRHPRALGFREEQSYSIDFPLKLSVTGTQNAIFSSLATRSTDTLSICKHTSKPVTPSLSPLGALCHSLDHPSAAPSSKAVSGAWQRSRKSCLTQQATSWYSWHCPDKPGPFWSQPRLRRVEAEGPESLRIGSASSPDRPTMLLTQLSLCQFRTDTLAP
ncbi:hypothetical protein BR93DRAFT_132772 [Coniochaeta sp. PMI_546]|nr:hypothetical protein BR93DRAFT_132772 [Coniochaeta sp. PMI_546]